MRDPFEASNWPTGSDVTPISESVLVILKLITLSENIKELTKLKTLILEENRLIKLPECVYDLPQLILLKLNNNSLKTLSIKIKQISKVNITSISYDMNNLSNDCAYMQIDNFHDPYFFQKTHQPMTNLPASLEEIRFYKSDNSYVKNNVKIPFGCKLYIDDVLQN